MWKRWLIVLILPFIFLIGCGTKTTEKVSGSTPESMELTGVKPPEANIKIGETTYPTTLGTYCWSSSTESICVDTSGPEELLKGKEPILVKPGESITFVMDYQPQPNEVDVALFKNGEPTKVDVKGNTFKVPEEPGIYYYSYGVWWKDAKEENVSHGDAFYAFVIEVE